MTKEPRPLFALLRCLCWLLLIRFSLRNLRNLWIASLPTHGTRSQRPPLQKFERDRRHAEVGVDRLCCMVLIFYIEAESDHIGFVHRQLMNVAIKLPKDTQPPILGDNINALDPPEPAVAPVAPFVCHTD